MAELWLSRGLASAQARHAEQTLPCILDAPEIYANLSLPVPLRKLVTYAQQAWLRVRKLSV